MIKSTPAATLIRILPFVVGKARALLLPVSRAPIKFRRGAVECQMTRSSSAPFAPVRIARRIDDTSRESPPAHHRSGDGSDIEWTSTAHIGWSADGNFKILGRTQFANGCVTVAKTCSILPAWCC